ncbi:MAG: bifunctional phosphoribosyl-AMP cyclohydrolase/phosphoribosyl-ATP diphosphatase HisIE [Saprospiraceae bacterium]|nr:bifunctional phosphoribosyl-AMP cyclohydrolase/phosphoribosyl-ATP diphosphatase HisIE [Saprospiraceae bacterium]
MMIDINKIDFKKGHGLVPVIAQDVDTQKVLMMGYANEEAIQVSQKSGKLTFFSRSKNRLWTKGEESGNFLEIISMALDCDVDTILAKVRPKGPVCHTGTDTCWAEANPPSEIHFIEKLESVIEDRKKRFNAENSYVASLFAKGINKIAQKVGEEAVEMVIESKDDNEALFLGEAADLLFHYLILLQAKGYKIEDVLKVLQERHK